MTDQAIEAHSGAYQIYCKLNSPASVSRCLHDLGLALARKGRTEAAMQCHLADLAICKARLDDRGLAMAYCVMGELTIELDRDRALEYIDLAIMISQQSGHADVEANALVVKARSPTLSRPTAADSSTTSCARSPLRSHLSSMIRTRY